MSKNKKRFVVDVYATATVKSQVIVDADDKEEAARIAIDVAHNPYGITDLNNTPIEGIGDLVWKYERMGDDSGESPVFEARPVKETSLSKKK